MKYAYKFLNIIYTHIKSANTVESQSNNSPLK